MDKYLNKNFLLWVFFISYLAATFIFPFLNVPTLIYAGLIVLLGSGFAVVHGVMRYGIRGMLVFIATCLLISNILENLSIQTGFPFGFYHYTDLLGPKLFAVPLLIGPAYFSTGYLSWTIANVFLNKTDQKLNNLTLVFLPVIASFIMVMWDVVMDPTSSTINKLWIWHDGGGFFGVPLTNYLGWFLTVYIFFQIFAFYLFKLKRVNEGNFPKSFWIRAILLYMSIGLSFFINYLLDKGGVVTDSAGNFWNIHAIRQSAVITSLYTMIFVSTLALFKECLLTNVKE